MLLSVINGLIFSLILIGVLLHRRANTHFWWMLACFALDLGLLLVVELGGDSAIMQTAEVVMGDDERRMWTMIHVGFSIVFLAIWFWALFLGLSLRKKPDQAARRLLFRKLAWIFLIARLGNVLTAPLVVG